MSLNIIVNTDITETAKELYTAVLATLAQSTIRILTIPRLLYMKNLLLTEREHTTNCPMRHSRTGKASYFNLVC